MTIRMSTLKAVPAIAALVSGLCAMSANVQAATPIFSKIVTSLITPYYGGGPRLPLRAGSLVLADFNGDGRMDAAVPGLFIAGVDVFLNSGNSVTQIWYDAGKSPVALAVGDFDGDGDIDLAVAVKGESGVAILTNDGTGQFTRTAFFATGLGCCAVAAADLNKDGRMDLVVANRQDGTITKLTSSAQGLAIRQTLFLPAALSVDQPPVSCQPNALTIADMDGNGWPDAVVACAADDSVRILSNQFGLLAPSRVCEAGPFPVAVAAGDVNGDALPDLVVADLESPQVTVLLQDLAGQFTPQDLFLVSVPYGAFTAPIDVTLVDVDNNASLDIRCAGYVLYNNGTGQFGAPQVQEAAHGICTLSRLAGYPGKFLGTTHNTDVYYPHYSGTYVTVTYLRDANAIPADVNGDGYVNVGDLQLLVASWGLKTGDAGFDFRADLNDDTNANVGDLQLLVANWGNG